MKKNLAFILVSLFTLSLVSCMDEKFSSSPSDNISIQTDTVDYNTIFTTIKQPTSVIKIYNRNKTALTISYIKVAGGEASPFKMTVNGQKGQTFNNIDIFSKDSIYVFIDMTLPENGKNTPVVVSDSLLIMCNGIEKKVILTGSGQDVTILKNDTIAWAHKLQDAGVPVKVVVYNGMGHGYLNAMGVFPQAEDLVEEMGQLILECC